MTPREQEQSTAREALKLAVVFGVCRVLRCGNSEGQEVGRGSPGVWIHPTGSRAARALQQQGRCMFVQLPQSQGRLLGRASGPCLTEGHMGVGQGTGHTGSGWKRMRSAVFWPDIHFSTPPRPSAVHFRIQSFLPLDILLSRAECLALLCLTCPPKAWCRVFTSAITAGLFSYISVRGISCRVGSRRGNECGSHTRH